MAKTTPGRKDKTGMDCKTSSKGTITLSWVLLRLATYPYQIEKNKREKVGKPYSDDGVCRVKRKVS